MVKSDTESDKTTDYNDVANTEDFKDEVHVFLLGQRATYVSLRLRVQNAVPAQPCVGKLEISLVLLNFLHCNFRLWFKTP